MKYFVGKALKAANQTHATHMHQSTKYIVGKASQRTSVSMVILMTMNTTNVKLKKH